MAPSDAPVPPAPAADEDEVLVERARGGDLEAFRGLVERYQGRVFGMALRMVRRRETAEDVAQDVFLRAWRALPRFRTEARFSTWLYTIATRRAYDALRTQRVRGSHERPLEADPASSGAPSPANEPSGLSLERHVASLPDVQRAAITLFYYQDRSVAEVALAMGIPENTVKTHLHRGRAALRRAFQRDEAREKHRGLRRV